MIFDPREYSKYDDDWYNSLSAQDKIDPDVGLLISRRRRLAKKGNPAWPPRLQPNTPFWLPGEGMDREISEGINTPPSLGRGGPVMRGLPGGVLSDTNNQTASIVPVPRSSAVPVMPTNQVEQDTGQYGRYDIGADGNPVWLPPQPPAVPTTKSSGMGSAYREAEKDSMVSQHNADLKNRIASKKVKSANELSKPTSTRQEISVPGYHSISDDPYNKIPQIETSGLGERLQSLAGGATSAVGDFFKDPRRVALVQAGLTAMDPNSYYDPKGFHSTWGGLNKALMGGVKTYKDLSKPKKLGFEEQEKIKHKYALELEQEKAKSGTSMGEYRRVLRHYNSLPRGHKDRAFLKNRLQKMVRQEKSMRQKDYEYGEKIIKEGDPKKIAAWKATQPKGIQVDLGGRKFIVGPSGEIIYEGEVGFKPTEELSYVQEKEETLVGTRLNTEAVVSAKLGLPASIESAGYMTKLLDMARDHPGMTDVIGIPDNPLALGGYFPGTDAADFRTVYNQITGQQFMEAYKTLKGGGQITEIEGKKATDAMARMSTSQSEKAFIAALRDFREVVMLGLERQKTLAGVYRIEDDRGGATGGDPPEGLTQEEWDNMSDEDKKLWN